jgi:hypothetical protein
VLGRLSLSPAEVADLLDWNLAVDIGIESGTNRVHRLFFSAPDGVCFVAVQDQLNGAVVTVLPVDFHENIAWQVSLSAEGTARELASPGEFPAPKEPDPPPAGSPLRHLALPRPFLSRLDAVPTVALSNAAGPLVFRLGVYLWTPTGLARAVNLGSWPCRPYDGQVASLLEDEEFLCALDERLATKGVEDHEVDTFFVRLGQRGPITCISRQVPVVSSRSIDSERTTPPETADAS